MTALLIINVLAALVIFCHCVCRLSVRKWTWKQPEMWAHVALTGGSVGVMGHGLVSGAVHHPSEILINVGVAAYFLSLTWRQWQVGKLR